MRFFVDTADLQSLAQKTNGGCTKKQKPPPEGSGLCQCARLLEVELQAKLHEPWTAGLGNLPKRAAEPLIVRVQELRVVERVKHFAAELERFALGEFHSFQEREIPVVDAGAANRVSAQIAEGSNRSHRVVRWRDAVESCWIKVEVSGDVSVGIRRSTGTVCVGTDKRTDLIRSYRPDLWRRLGANPQPPSGWVADFQFQAIEHTPHTEKRRKT